MAGVSGWYSRCLAFSPDGKLLAANLDDNNSGGGIAIWETATGRFIKRLGGMYGSASLLAFSPDGRRIAAASYWDRTMCVWDLDTGKTLGTDKPGHLASPNTLRFFDADRQLATAGDDGAIRVWKIADGNQVRVMNHEKSSNRHNTWIRGMDVSPDGKYFVSSALDDTVRLWDGATGREIYRLPGHGQLGGHRAVQFTANGKQFASWGDDMHVYLWDVTTGKALQEYRAQPAGMALPPEDDVGADMPFGGGRELSGGYFSPNGKILAIDFNGLHRFDVPSGKELPALKAGGKQGAAVLVSPDEQFVLISERGQSERIPLNNGGQRSMPPISHSLALYRFVTGEQILQTDAPGNGGPIVFSPDGHRVASSGYVYDSDWNSARNFVEVRRVPELSVSGVIELPSNTRAIEFSSDGKLLATALGDTTVVVWDLEHLPDAAAK